MRWSRENEVNDVLLQTFIVDVGVLVAMVVITLIALVVVIIKVILVHNEVKEISNFYQT